MITVFGAITTRALRVTWMMEELAEPYHYHYVDLMKGAGRQPEFLAVNPAGKIPAIKVGDDIITESAAILNYLGECHPDAGMIPAAATVARGHYLQWSVFAVTELEQPLWNITKHSFVLPEKMRVPELIEKTVPKEFQKALRLLSEGLGTKQYILGSSFCAADILLAHTLIWSQAYGQPIEQENVVAYLARCKDRPAYKRAIAREEQEQAANKVSS